MNSYILYTIGEDKRFCSVATLDIGTDSEACEVAAMRLKKYPAIEVWQEARRVALVTQDGPQLAG